VTARYLDASAFVKLVVEEPESKALRAFLARPPRRRVSSALLRAEALRAVRHLGPEAVSRVRAGLRRIDLIGVDVHVHASEALHGQLGEPRMAPPERLVRMQAEGRLGRKSGAGFYTY